MHSHVNGVRHKPAQSWKHRAYGALHQCTLHWTVSACEQMHLSQPALDFGTKYTRLAKVWPQLHVRAAVAAGWSGGLHTGTLYCCRLRCKELLMLAQGLQLFGEENMTQSDWVAVERAEQEAQHDRMVVLADVWLDKPQTLDSLHTVFAGALCVPLGAVCASTLAGHMHIKAKLPLICRYQVMAAALDGPHLSVMPAWPAAVYVLCNVPDVKPNSRGSRSACW